jgi:type VI protein secretion system component Hcp
MSEETTGWSARAAGHARRATRLPLKALIPCAIALGAGGAFAAAAIPGSGGVITACYSTHTTMADVLTTDSQGDETDDFVPQYGSVRVIDPSAAPATAEILSNDTTTTVNSYNNACAPWEQTVTWNQQGPQGPAGAPGAAGPAGPAGADASITGASGFDVKAAKSTNLYGRLSGINGAVTSKGESDTISLQEFAFGAEQTLVNPIKGATGANPGTTLQTFEIVKKVDKTSATLLKDLTAARPISTLTVDVAHVSKGKSTVVARYTLTNVVLKNISQKGNAETVSGVFSKLSSTVGSGSDTVTTSGLTPGKPASWDLENGSSS